MAAGVPTVTSNRSSMKEIADGYGFLADPDVPESISEQLSNALMLADNLRSGSEEAKYSIKKTQDHARKFTWRACAEGTISAFGEACGRRVS